jgi:hemin uptake protein HemP
MCVREKSALTTPPGAPRVLSTADLFASASEVLIRHGSDTYRLRLTRQGKLILNK